MTSKYIFSCACCDQPFFEGDRIIYTKESFIHDRCVGKSVMKKGDLIFDCPICEGEGTVSHPTNLVQYEIPLKEDENPDCSYNECEGCRLCKERVKLTLVSEQVTCESCKGFGVVGKDPVTNEWKSL